MAAVIIHRDFGALLYTARSWDFIKKNPLEIIKQIQYNFRVKNQCTKRSIAFLHANNELEERNVKKTIPFTITTKKK